jgi:hypothetical protein
MLIEAMLSAITIGTLRGLVAAWSCALVAGVIVTEVVRRLRRRHRWRSRSNWPKKS